MRVNAKMCLYLKDNVNLIYKKVMNKSFKGIHNRHFRNGCHCLCSSHRTSRRLIWSSVETYAMLLEQGLLTIRWYIELKGMLNIYLQYFTCVKMLRGIMSQFLCLF